MRRQPRKDVLKIDVGIVAVHLGRLNQVHDGGSAAANRVDELLPWNVAPSLSLTARVEPIR